MRLRLGLAVLALAGCTHSPAYTPESASSSFLSDVRLRPGAIVGAVSSARHLPARDPVPMVVENEHDFLQSLATGRHLPIVPVDTRPFHLAFGFPVPGPAESTGRVSALQDEQVAAFYDPDSRVIHVRARSIAKGDAAARVVVAHEIGHALRHQRSGDPDLGAIDEDDARLAYLALLEGDATLTALADVAQRRHTPLHRAAARWSELVRDGDLYTMAVGDPGTRVLRNASAIDRDRLLFPYLEGTAFVGDLYRAGGFPLVERAFAHPPTTTEQVLHPKKYVAGEHAIPVRTPEAPKGWTVALRGRLGELLLGAVLSRCLSKADASEVARGWGGDAYSVVVRNSVVGLLWSTVWDDEEAATHFAQTLRTTAGCWNDVSAWEPYRAGRGILVRQKGVRVAVVRGFEAEAESVIDPLLDLPSAPIPPSDHFAGVKIPRIKPPADAKEGVLRHQTFTSEMLAVESKAPAGSTPRLDDSRRGYVASIPGVAVSLGLSDEVDDRGALARTAESFASAVEKLVPNIRLTPTGRGEAKTSLGIGREARWRFGAHGNARVVLVPICNGTGAYVIIAAWSDDEDRVVERWFRDLESTTDGDPPICNELDP